MKYFVVTSCVRALDGVERIYTVTVQAHSSQEALGVALEEAKKDYPSSLVLAWTVVEVTGFVEKGTPKP